MNLSLLVQRKVTKRKDIPGVRASHSRSLDATQWNPGMLKVAEKSRITLRFIQVTGLLLRLLP
jgi:hypothetical protein